MDGRKIVLLVAALLVAAVTAFMARSLMQGAATPVAAANNVAPNADGPQVLVATRALPVGTILDESSMKFQPWPKELVEGAYYLKDKTPDLKALQGTVVRFAIPAGQPITQGALVKPGDRGFLAAALAPGMRAVTVPVSAQTSVAGFIFPGDRVDLILTQSVAGGGDGSPLKTSETVLRNLRVLATDQKTDKSVDDKGNTVVNTYSMVTIEATPKIAEKIAVAQTLGSLSLSLRSIADNAGELEEAIASGEVNVPDGDKAEKAMLASVAARPVDGKGTFSTGADVSRFQRSTVPGKPVEAGGAGGAPQVLAAPSGPMVRVVRGNNVQDVVIGSRVTPAAVPVPAPPPVHAGGTPSGGTN
ncbi:Flp pilus assembly protein CpaB [Sphingomonas cannabina]|uniref:Flp pilus assembly protein CpaB n=1 Tax=Sphingomonas cannabina TaxID=2899123 RepID=UPI001F355408|nr:Flp pilus assembly protein CpaB [Sphingomonas cannabina]UIJ44546.1 Flp pilus assembly protein CpaB [Sphingomonas cannabina]